MIFTIRSKNTYLKMFYFQFIQTKNWLRKEERLQYKKQKSITLNH